MVGIILEASTCIYVLEVIPALLGHCRVRPSLLLRESGCPFQEVSRYKLKIMIITVPFY